MRSPTKPSKRVTILHIFSTHRGKTLLFLLFTAMLSVIALITASYLTEYL